jgi:hypothetical protein
MSSLVDEYPKEQARLRSLLEVYHSLGPIGLFGATVIEQTLKEADVAVASGDIVAMVRCFQAMKDCQ